MEDGMSEVTPMVDEGGMLRAYGETIKLKDAQIERLKDEFQKALEWNQISEIQIKNLQNIVEAQSDLLTRAADALQDLDRFAFYCWSCRNEKLPELIAELRKAAE
jgi:hypothetical protein